MVFFALLLTIMMAFSVFLRYVLDQSFPAVEEICILIGIWLYFVGMVVVTRERSHLTGGVLDLINLTPRVRALIKAFNDLVGLCVLCLFSFYTFKYLLFVMKINRTSTNLEWPIAVYVSAAIFGFVLMVIYKIRDLFMHENKYSIYDIKSPHSPDSMLKELSK
jgi:TRAP-type C4-dicarboxylate transport system permease small subunit